MVDLVLWLALAQCLLFYSMHVVVGHVSFVFVPKYIFSES